MKIFYKKFIQLIFLIFISTTIVSKPAVAETDYTAILNDIKKNTDGILQQINMLPQTLATYLTSLRDMANEWLAINETPAQQKAVANITAHRILFSHMQLAKQLDLSEQIAFTKEMTEQFQGIKFVETPEVDKVLPGATDASSLFQHDVFPETQPITPGGNTGDKPNDLAQQYLRYLSGANIALRKPDIHWTGNKIDKNAYQNLYYTLSAIQSYNNHILGRLYAEREPRYTYPKDITGRSEGAKASTKDLLTVLTGQTSSEEWYKLIQTEPLGMVLRHILMFSSQTFVLINQQLQTQQQMVEAQTMTNTLLLTSINQSTGNFMAQKAMEKAAGAPKL